MRERWGAAVSLRLSQAPALAQAGVPAVGVPEVDAVFYAENMRLLRVPSVRKPRLRPLLVKCSGITEDVVAPDRPDTVTSFRELR
jgi:hypothetical protein